jgi:hypothetical protein
VPHAFTLAARLVKHGLAGDDDKSRLSRAVGPSFNGKIVLSMCLPFGLLGVFVSDYLKFKGITSKRILSFRSIK